MDSLWFDGVRMPIFEPMDHSISTDVLIIGGGIAGILCAYSLKQSGIEVTLVEAKRICRLFTE